MTRSAISGPERDHLYVFTLAGRRRSSSLRATTTSGARVVARRPVDRIPEPAAAGVRPDRQLGPLRRRRRSRRRAAAAHHVPRGGHGPRVGQPRRRAGARTGSSSPTSRAGNRSCSTTGGRRSRWCRRPAGRRGSSPATLDRNVLSPTFSPDGASVLFLLEDDRVYHLARVPAAGGAVERLVEGKRAIEDFRSERTGGSR